MSIERCTRCGVGVDLDWHSDEIIYVDGKAVCLECATRDEKLDSEIEEDEKESVSDLVALRNKCRNDILNGKFYYEVD